MSGKKVRNGDDALVVCPCQRSSLEAPCALIPVLPLVTVPSPHALVSSFGSILQVKGTGLTEAGSIQLN